MQLDRLPNESDLDYHKRLVYGKLIDKTLADIDYSELAKIVYGQPYSSDVARRMMYGSCRTLQLQEREVRDSIDDASVVSEIDSKLIELKKEQQKFYDQRRELNKIVSVVGRREHLEAALTEAANNLSESVGRLYDDDRVLFVRENDYCDTEAVLVLCDWHYGMVTDNVFNTYNTEICKKRVREIVSSTIERIILHKCRRLHIAVLGDLCHGAIHTSARVASEELACEQIMQVSEILAQSIEELSMYVEETLVYITYGNHARTVQNKNDSIHRDNMERLVPWWLTQRFINNDRVLIMPEEDTEFLFINACGHDICATHGDLDCVRSSPRLLPSLIRKRYGKEIEYILLGDKHHRESIEEIGVTAMVCNALCGSDDYANNKRLYSTPGQCLLIANEAVGIDAEYRLKCTT